MSIQSFLDQLAPAELIDRLQLALAGADLGIWDWDLRDNSVQFDPVWCRMLGLKHDQIRMELKTWEERVHPDDLQACYSDITAHIEGRTEQYENIHRMRHADGRWVYILDRGRISGRDEEGKPVRFTGTHFDVTVTEQARLTIEAQRKELEQLYAREKELSRTDSLTGLVNQRGFMEELERELERCRRSALPLCLAYIDLDNFKKVNDTYGHAAGDEALQKLAAKLQQRVRTADVVARTGGDEFLVLLWSPQPDGPLEVIGQRWIEATLEVAAQYPEAGLGASVGIAYCHNGALENTDQALRIADGAMYESKRTGRRQVSVVTVRTPEESGIYAASASRDGKRPK
ncbi:MAG: sensor domain-containing diguanylate cyclase [Spirochaetales bacterium]|nr:sensor domain-containing diguanylate cyclase [Leptospiraceae bacterium]MCP5482905.1 sensor domain-containing diguanylate cyclase [Spirochaetales bacterium]MCP5486970.1 sensor domain-containing diguanylate cyclase [Spirochaetales bacterium]